MKSEFVDNKRGGKVGVRVCARAKSITVYSPMTVCNKLIASFAFSLRVCSSTFILRLKQHCLKSVRLVKILCLHK
ncbi:hypothetical protein AG1IA_06966 [Rhizoctonia solani AG-1 IA]|uniref:Uncharacterized protein n=1 Tax=Thanatephorus cucumeris (strain AG1-IA) TaxID=983506 RepID=L8WRK4_THACA|nr:hypothetical protein AG1IA_06966 [Rhizoctonia solani AG-1 IA]